jgi:hypothetical protein
MRAWLPDDFGEGEEGPVVIAGWDHDMGPRVVNADLRERLLELERQGKCKFFLSADKNKACGLTDLLAARPVS